MAVLVILIITPELTVGYGVSCNASIAMNNNIYHIVIIFSNDCYYNWYSLYRQLTEHTEYDYVMNTRWLAKDQNQICQEAIPLETNASYTTSGTVTNVNPPRGIAQTTNHSQEHILIEANPSYTTTSTVNEGQASGTPLKPNLEEDVLLEANPSYISSI